MTRKINLREYEEAARHWQATHPGANHDLIHRKALAHIDWKHRNLKPMDKAKRLDWRLLVILALLLLLGLLLIPHAHAQFSKINSIQYQQNGSNVAFITYPHTLNFSGCTVSFSGSVGSINCTGGGGGVSLTPSVTQNIIQPLGTSFSTNIFANARLGSPSWNWSQSPTGTLSIGANTVTLTPCPPGIDTSNFTFTPYPVSINSGTEYAIVTGGTCTSGAASGTIVFTTLNNYTAGFTVGSASSGIQEAINDSCRGSNYANPSPGNCEIDLFPAQALFSSPNYTIGATVYLGGRAGQRFILHGHGAIIGCTGAAARSTCLYNGNLNSTTTYNIIDDLSIETLADSDGVQVSDVTAASGTYTVHTASAHTFSMTGNAGQPDKVEVNFYVNTGAAVNTGHLHQVFPVASVADNTHFTFTIGSATYANATGFGFAALQENLIENNAEGSIFHNVREIWDGVHRPNHAITNDGDQHMTVDKFVNIGGAPSRSTANFPMGSLIWSGGTGGQGIIYLNNSELSLQCAGNAVDQTSGNGFVADNDVVQGYNIFGIRSENGLVTSSFKDPYQEAASTCANLLYPGSGNQRTSAMGIFIDGQNATLLGNFPVSGQWPTFATGGAGANERSYYVVPTSSVNGVGPPLPAGIALPVNGATSITVVWPQVALGLGDNPGTVTWDVLATIGTANVPLFGTQTIALATGISGSCGTNGMCSFTDTQAAPSSYAIAAPVWIPHLWYWPGTLVLSRAVLYMPGQVYMQSVVSSFGTSQPSVFARSWSSTSSNFPTLQAPTWIEAIGSDPGAGTGTFATVLDEADPAGNSTSQLKGRLNFGKLGNLINGDGTQHIITLTDTNFPKTISTKGHRPASDNTDSFIGTDGGNGTGISFGANVSLSNYIGNHGDGSNWIERLTSSLKTFRVPIVQQSVLFASLPGSPVNGESVYCSDCTVTTPGSCTNVTTAAACTCASGGTGAEARRINGAWLCN